MNHAHKQLSFTLTFHFLGKILLVVCLYNISDPNVLITLYLLMSLDGSASASDSVLVLAIRLSINWTRHPSNSVKTSWCPPLIRINFLISSAFSLPFLDCILVDPRNFSTADQNVLAETQIDSVSTSFTSLSNPRDLASTRRTSWNFPATNTFWKTSFFSSQTAFICKMHKQKKNYWIKHFLWMPFC